MLSSYVSKILIDKNDEVWIGTGDRTMGISGGLSKFDGTAFTNYYPSENGLPGNFVYDLAFDKNENLWIATENGLARFDGNKWKIYNTSNSGLPSNLVTSVTVDLDQNKWVAAEAVARYIGGKK